MQNFTTLGHPLLGEKYVAWKGKKEERKIITKIVDTSVRTPHSARNKIRVLRSLCCLKKFNWHILGSVLSIYMQLYLYIAIIQYLKF